MIEGEEKKALSVFWEIQIPDYCTGSATEEPEEVDESVSSSFCDVVAPSAVAVANLGPTVSILILTFSPSLAPFTKTTKPWIFATPSPRLESSVTSTSYSLPTSTGFGPIGGLPPPNPSPLLPPLPRESRLLP